MSSTSDPMYLKMAASLEAGAAGRARAEEAGPARHISPAVAHELNNILTIIQGYSDRLLFKHGDAPELQRQLTVISEAARRAATLVRSATPPEAGQPARPQPNPSAPLPVA